MFIRRYIFRTIILGSHVSFQGSKYPSIPMMFFLKETKDHLPTTQQVISAFRKQMS